MDVMIIYLYALCSWNYWGPSWISNYCETRWNYVTVAIGMMPIKSISLPNPLVTWQRLNDNQRQIVVQGDGDHDLCTGGSYAEATVVLTST